MEDKLKELIDKMIELSDMQDNLQTAREELQRLESQTVRDEAEIRRQKVYIRELENKARTIQTENEIKKMIDDYKKEINDKEIYWTEQINSLEEEVANATDEQLKQTYQEALDGAKESLAHTKILKERAAKFNFEEIMAKIAISKSLIKELREEQKKQEKNIKDFDEAHGEHGAEKKKLLEDERMYAKQVDDIETKIVEYEEKIKNIKFRKIPALTFKIADLKRKLESGTLETDEANKVKEELNEREAELKATEEELDGIEKEFEEFKNKNGQKLEEAKENLKQIRTTLRGKEYLEAEAGQHRIDKEKGKQERTAKNYEDIINDVINPEVSRDACKAKADRISNNRRREKLGIKTNVYGRDRDGNEYEMTIEQAEEELRSLLARLEEEPDLDNPDNPEYNKQAILNRIAELREILGIKDDKELDPNPPGPRGPRDPGGQEPDPPGPLVDVNSGLQQFRKQMNYIRDHYPIEDRHTLSERVALPQALVGMGGTALLAGVPGMLGLTAIAPWIGLPVIGAAIAIKPLAKSLTGQNRIEAQITEQLENMAENDRENFDLMVDYLSEEKIQDLKPNAVFLRALHNVMIKTTRADKEELTETMTALRDKQKQLLITRQTRELNPNELDELKKINDEIDRIEKEKAPIVEKRLKDIRRGKDRVSQRYKGNLLTRLNIFAHRNSSSAMYDKPLNEYADAEYSKLCAEKLGDQETRATSSREMSEVMQKYTTRNGLGVQTSVFNARPKNNPVRIISDKADNTIKHLTMVSTALLGLVGFMAQIKKFTAAQAANEAEYNKVLNAANGTNNTQAQNVIKGVRTQISNFQKNHPLSQKTIQRASDGKTVEGVTMEETAILHRHGDFTPQYFAEDQNAQNALQSMLKSGKIKAGDEPSMLRQLAAFFRTVGNTSGQNLANAAQGTPHFRVDHTAQFAVERNTPNLVNAEADVVEHCADSLELLSDVQKKLAGIQFPTNTIPPNFQKVIPSFTHLISGAISTAFGIGKDVQRKHEERPGNGLDLDMNR